MQPSITRADFKAVKLTPEQINQVADFEIRFFVLASQIEDEIPAGAHRTAALRQLLETKMTAIHAISRSTYNQSAADESAPCNSSFQPKGFMED